WMERRVPFRRRASNSIAASVIQFAVTGMVVVLLLGLAAVELLRHTGTSEAIRDAKQVTRLAGDAVVAPNVTAALERGDPKAIAAMDRIVHTGLLSNSVVRVKLWNTRGRIVYSDEHRLIGLTIPLKADELAALRQGGVQAEVSNLSRPENRYERGYKKLLEVYLGVRAPSGQRLLFESYQRFSSISASGARLWQRFLPALIGALLLLELAQIPLAWSLGRRLRRGQREREALLRRAIDASALERRRIAGDLHDGAVQNLAGVSYGLSAVIGELPAGSPARSAVEMGASETRRTVRELRTLLVDIYPPVLRRSGLAAALSDLLDGFSAGGLEVRLDARPDLELAPEVEELLFRVAQEALRNVRRHADARTVVVSVDVTEHSALLEVSDDGRGFEPGGAHESNGHFGLRVVGDLVRDAGGELEVISAPGQGTIVRVEMPRR
ncbi:MAG: two-component system, NarL family, sensor kinase, partial [Solirubrobacteraceae bacterium]|nr:two-component system, NarL family, sensor kinase [Solirubrobacteraceae bacterium]